MLQHLEAVRVEEETSEESAGGHAGLAAETIRRGVRANALFQAAKNSDAKYAYESER